MKKLLNYTLFLIILLGINQVAFLSRVQFICNQKITEGKDLNLYETLSAYQTHTSFWLFGWIVSPNTAQLCFCKQFFIQDPLWLFPIKENNQLKEAKQKLQNGADTIRLAWKTYNDETSLFLNGSYISRTMISDDEYMYLYKIPSSYKPGIIKVGPITICETVFDYLENKHIISDYVYYRGEVI